MINAHRAQEGWLGGGSRHRGGGSGGPGCKGPPPLGGLQASPAQEGPTGQGRWPEAGSAPGKGTHRAQGQASPSQPGVPLSPSLHPTLSSEYVTLSGASRFHPAVPSAWNTFLLLSCFLSSLLLWASVYNLVPQETVQGQGSVRGPSSLCLF